MPLSSVAALIDQETARLTVREHRKHLGGSQIGRSCERELWYAFRWATLETFSGRMLRLFTRGQTEEAVLVAALRRIGVHVWDTDPARPGEQFRVSALNEHFGGSLDGLARNIPELDPQECVLLEFKTHNQKSFDDLKEHQVHQSKRVHFAQMQVYLGLMGLRHALYLAVNKNTDELHSEIVTYDPISFDQLMTKANRVIFARTAPPRISNSPAYYECKWCTFKQICHYNAEPDKSCRSCHHGSAATEGRWFCDRWNSFIPETVIAVGCDDYKAVQD